tara:strand:+ start:813 stop:1127 length:315 start_codon:yes stop_codon:yes gene_type:complete
VGDSDPWTFDPSVVGARGSEGGPILVDAEHELGARITLEARGAVAPFAITCGIYGVFVHTCFFSLDQEARRALEDMKAGIAHILQLECPDAREGAVDAFVERFP